MTLSCSRRFQLCLECNFFVIFQFSKWFWYAHYAICSNNVLFGRPFVKLFALCYWSLVCLSCPVCDVGVLWPNGWMDQDETWHAGRPRLCPHVHIVLDGNPAPLPKRGTAPIFWPMSVVAKWLDGWGCHLVRRQALAQATLWRSPQIFAPWLLWPNGSLSPLLLSSCNNISSFNVFRIDIHTTHAALQCLSCCIQHFYLHACIKALYE